MKRMFEEPKVFVERFTATDQTMNASWVIPDRGNDETNPYGIAAITSV